MRTTKRRQLTRDEWEVIGGQTREVLAILRRLASGVRRIPRRGKVDDLLGRMLQRAEFGCSIDVALLAAAQTGVDADGFGALIRGDGPHQSAYPWAGDPGPLDRTQWVELGRDVKRLHRLLMDAERGLQPTTNQKARADWDWVYRKLQTVKCQLDTLAYKAQPGWPEFTRVFYGDRDPGGIAHPPTLRDHSDARNRCRAGLIGLTVRRVEGGPELRVECSRWDPPTPGDPRGPLVVDVGTGRYELASLFIPTERWADPCCPAKEPVMAG